jgi:GWxTD domain-containing protein
MVVLNSKGEGNLWKHEQSINGEDTNFTLNLNIPDSVLKGIKYSLKAFLIQKNNSVSKSVNFSLKKAGISAFISDMSDAIEQMRYILDDKEKLELKNSNRKDRERLFRSFWKNRDPTPHGFHNELMEEYYRRVHYSNEHFTGFQPGWESDMGMIYILFGVPDDVERINVHRERKIYEVWHYLEINNNFTFVDENGFGDFRLQTPFLGY